MLVPVILSGGSGSRLWPISREAYPKPFMRLGHNSLSLLQKTYTRAMQIPHVKHIITVTNAAYYYQSKQELHTLPNISPEKKFHFLLEPISRNTAPAIALSALLTEKLVGSDAILLVLPADHLIANQDKFNDCIIKAYGLAKKMGLLTIFGIVPHKAETAYGYIKYNPIPLIDSGYKVESFHEKPSKEEAQTFLNEGNYLWNSGIFCFPIKSLQKELKKHMPEIYKKILQCWKVSKKNTSFSVDSTNDKFKLEKTHFSKIDNISIDYALMEKTRSTAVIRANFDWSDMGTWDMLDKLIPPDQKGNRVLGHAILKESHNTTIYNHSSSKRIITALGLKNITIVDTSDALLISDRLQIPQIKQLVEELKSNQHKCYRYHQTIYRPWGCYLVLDEGSNYKIKRIMVHPGASLSLQIHRYRSEHWTIVTGIATVQNNQKKLTLKEQESTFISTGSPHRLSNHTEQDLVVIEIQIGSYLGEDDIIRLKDVYDREDANYEVAHNTS